jgi:hypothetical protein
MLKLLHYQENGENKGSQMGHTKKKNIKKKKKKKRFCKKRYLCG